MLKKYRLLFVFIVLTAGGIGTVLGLWLWNSYLERRDFFRLGVERGTYEVLANFYEDKKDSFEIDAKDSTTYFNRFERRFLGFVHDIYPVINTDSVLSEWQHAVDEYFLNRPSRSNGRRGGRVLPPFLLSRIDFNPSAIAELNTNLNKFLKDQNWSTSVELTLFNKSQNQTEELKEDTLYASRPILIDADNNLYLGVKCDQLWLTVIKNMLAPIFLSVFLIIALIAIFYYLLSTIIQQNKDALQRKAFVNNMTHELKTPVSIAMAAIESIEKFGIGDQKQKREEYLSLAKKELDHLIHTIDEVLMVDVHENTQVSLNFSQFDLGELIQECVDAHQITHKGNAVIKFQQPVDSIVISADREHIRNVFSNLIDNAVKYSQADQQALVELSVKEKKTKIEIRARDNGKGIGDEHIKSIFELFYRVPEGHLHSVKGFGLGLAYVKQIVELHGGSVEVRSQLAKGSTFIVNLMKKQP